jgi:hypothetical protein
MLRYDRPEVPHSGPQPGQNVALQPSGDALLANPI